MALVYLFWLPLKESEMLWATLPAVSDALEAAPETASEACCKYDLLVSWALSALPRVASDSCWLVDLESSTTQNVR